MKQLIRQHQVLVGIVGVVVCVFIAGVYVLNIPSQVETSSGITKYVLWFSHPAVWILLAAATASWTVGAKKIYVVTFAYMALVVYALFLILLIV